MKFSVIVPVYNTGAYLPVCVDSVLKQTYENWELIIINDGSTDDSGDVIKKLASKDQRIHVVQQENMGQLYARRRGLEFACGDYILFLDSDDYWDHDCLKTIENAIIHYQADVIFFCAKRVGTSRQCDEVLGTVTNEIQWLDKTCIYEEMISGHKYNSLCLKAWKRDLFHGDTTDYTSFAALRWGEDKVQLLFPITKAKNILFIPETLYYYVDNSGSVTRKMDMSRIPDMLGNKIFGLLHTYMKLWDIDTPDNREKLAVYYLRNYISTYYRVRKAYGKRLGRKNFSSYHWHKVVSEEAFQFKFSNRLSFVEKCKIILAWYFCI